VHIQAFIRQPPIKRLERLFDRVIRSPPGPGPRRGAAGAVRLSFIYSRLAGCEDTNDPERLAEDPVFQMLASRERRETSVDAHAIPILAIESPLMS
jgi:hypothetical protein